MAKIVLYNSYDGVEYRYGDVLSIDILEDYLRIDFKKPMNLYGMRITPEVSRATALYINKSQFTSISWLED